jgi:hypothetical protein
MPNGLTVFIGAVVLIIAIGLLIAFRTQATTVDTTTGSGLIEANTTSTAVLHGLSSTPDEVLTSLTSATAVTLSVTSKGVTTFTVVSNLTSTSAITFDWLARRE